MKIYNRYVILVVILLIGAMTLTGCGSTTKNEPTLITFEDDFSDTYSGWKVDSSEFVQYNYVDGKYQIKVSKASWLYWAYAPIELLGSEYTMQADMMWAEGIKGRYGFIFNYVDSDDYYLFRVNPITQNYSVRRKLGETWENIIEWTQDTENINIDNNHLKLVQNEDKLDIYANEILLATTTIVKHSGGIKVGFVASTLSDESYLPIAVEFDNFQVSGVAAQITD